MSWITETIAPKSDQLNAEDLITGPITVTVTSVRRGSAEQPAIIEIDGGRQPFKPCKTARRVLVACWGDDVDKWVGRRMTLFHDKSVKWAGEEVGGIRISHLSDINGEQIFKLSVARGSRKPVKILPLPAIKQPAKDAVLDKHRSGFAKATPEVKSLCGSIAKAYQSADVQALQGFSDAITQQPEQWREPLDAFVADALDAISQRQPEATS